MVLNGDSEYISGCLTCTDYAKGDVRSRAVPARLNLWSLLSTGHISICNPNAPTVVTTTFTFGSSSVFLE